MAKVIKLKQSDIEKIVTKIVNENKMDSIDSVEVETTEQNGDAVTLTLGKDKDGNFYVFKGDGSTPEIITKT